MKALDLPYIPMAEARGFTVTSGKKIKDVIKLYLDI